MGPGMGVGVGVGWGGVWVWRQRRMHTQRPGCNRVAGSAFFVVSLVMSPDRIIISLFILFRGVLFILFRAPQLRQ